MTSELSIIVVTLKQEEQIPSLQALSDRERDRCEIIICDSKGISKARNDGIRKASNEKVVFLDDDAIPREGYVDQAIRSLENHAIVAGRVIDTGHPWVGKTVRHYDQGDQPKTTNTIVGCNMGFRKEVFESGTFDENIQWGHDEKELIDRVSSEYDIHYDPEMVVEHPYASDVRDYLKKQYRLGVADIYYWKNRDDPVTRNVLGSIISPREYIDYSVKGTIVKIPGGLVKSSGRLRGYYRLRSGAEIFD